MTDTQFILTDELETVVAAVKAALGLSVLNYQYGEVEELNETLKQWEQDPNKFDEKFPLIWVAEPYQVTRSNEGIYGTAEVNVFIINQTQKDWKAKERMENNFKPVILPIYRELLTQIGISTSFDHPMSRVPEHKTVNRYYMGENRQSTLNDVVDAMKISGMKIRISEKQNCSPFTNM